MYRHVTRVGCIALVSQLMLMREQLIDGVKRKHFKKLTLLFKSLNYMQLILIVPLMHGLQRNFSFMVLACLSE